MKSKMTKKVLTFILLFSGMFSFSDAAAQFHCDCAPGNPVGYCAVNNHGQIKCVKFKKFPDGWLQSNQNFEFNSLAISPDRASKSAIISIFLEHSKKISLRVFDMVGNVVSTLPAKTYEEGENKLVLNTEKMNGEIYFLQIQSEENRETVKMILTK